MLAETRNQRNFRAKNSPAEAFAAKLRRSISGVLTTVAIPILPLKLRSESKHVKWAALRRVANSTFGFHFITLGLDESADGQGGVEQPSVVFPQPASP
jgi:hypothetical protein